MVQSLTSPHGTTSKAGETVTDASRPSTPHLHQQVFTVRTGPTVLAPTDRGMPRVDDLRLFAVGLVGRASNAEESAADLLRHGARAGHQGFAREHAIVRGRALSSPGDHQLGHDADASGFTGISASQHGRSRIALRAPDNQLTQSSHHPAGQDVAAAQVAGVPASRPLPGGSVAWSAGVEDVGCELDKAEAGSWSPGRSPPTRSSCRQGPGAPQTAGGDRCCR